MIFCHVIQAFCTALTRWENVVRTFRIKSTQILLTCYIAVTSSWHLVFTCNFDRTCKKITSIGIFNRTGIWCCAVTSVFGLHYSITTSGPHVIYAIVFATWRHCARLCDTWFLGSHESTPNGVCITSWRFSCFTTAVHKLSIVFAWWHHCAPPCKYHTLTR